MKNEFTLLNFLQWTVSVSRHEEYRSKKGAALNGGKCTATKVFELMTAPPPSYPPELLAQWEQECEKYLPNEHDHKIATSAIMWVRGMSESERGKQFRANIFNLVAYGKVSRETAGLAASILDAYERNRSENGIKYERKVKKKETIRKYKGRAGL